MDNSANAVRLTLISGPRRQIVQIPEGDKVKIVCTFSYLNGALSGFVTVLIRPTALKTLMVHTRMTDMIIREVSDLVAELIERERAIARFYVLDRSGVLVELNP